MLPQGHGPPAAPPAHLAHFDIRLNSASGRLMTGNSRLRSTRPVLDEQIAPLNGIISALIRQQTL
eukprot:8906880-Pyramimonas_sp.AAC.1